MKDPGLQERFLNALRIAGRPATFYLVNGFQMKGVLSGFDDYTLLLTAGNEQKLIFKHALSTVVPEGRLEL